MREQKWSYYVHNVHGQFMGTALTNCIKADTVQTSVLQTLQIIEFLLHERTRMVFFYAHNAWHGQFITP